MWVLLLIVGFGGSYLVCGVFVFLFVNSCSKVCFRYIIRVGWRKFVRCIGKEDMEFFISLLEIKVKIINVINVFLKDNRKEG